jgi:uncharacterized protein (UPF0332 family)
LTPETGLFLAKARRLLGEAEGMLSMRYNDAAGRTAYLAGFHAAQALISERTGRGVKTHSGVRTEFHRLIRGDTRFDDTLRDFLGATYNLHDRRRVTPEHWFKPASMMRTLFADLPEACDNTLAIARRCAAMAETHKPLLPVCPKVRPGASEEETVRAMAVEGLERRMDAAGADAATRAVKAIADYETGPGSDVSPERAARAIDDAKHFVAKVGEMLEGHSP